MAKVLVVDDNPDLRELIASLAVQEGHTVLRAADTQAARAELGSKPDLIFLDVDMPGETGISMVIRLRVTDPAFDTPIVFVTAHPERIDALKKSGKNRIDVIAKPFRADEILQALRRHLESRGGF